jgi:hypothetical protein
MVTINGSTVPVAVLEAIRKLAGPQQKAAFMYDKVKEQLENDQRGGRPAVPQDERFALGAAVLAYWNELLRSGTITFGTAENAWKTDVFQLSEVGREALKKLDRDPINPSGYMRHLQERVTINPISESYVREALNTYRAGCHKATAVMIGTAAEGMILSLRDALCNRLKAAKHKPAKGMDDWRIKVICDALAAEFEKWQGQMPTDLSGAYNTYWHGFTAHIRAIRNASGHPNSIDPVTAASVHAALLIFPDFAYLATSLEKWAKGHTF